MSTNHGGKRAGAGRKKTPRTHDAPHRARPSLSPNHPVHVVLRTTPAVRRLRNAHVYRALRRVLVRYLGRDGFRIVHISIQRNHLHLLVEAADRRVLARSMQSFAINAARAINQCDRRRGKVFAYRYHATQIRTPLHARHALAYVLNNWRRHREAGLANHLDPYASGVAFDGWSRRVSVGPPWPVSPPRTGLLRFDWQLHGLIDLFETPGPA